MLKTDVLHNINYDTFYFSGLTDEQKAHNLFEIEIFCNIINVFTDTFD